MVVLHLGFWAVSLVLIGSGAAKITQPQPFARFVTEAIGRTARTGFVQAIAAVEVLLGLVGLVLGGRTVAAAVALVYLAFALAVIVAMRKGSPSCGCFGAASSEPKAAHLVMNLGSSLVAVFAATLGVPPLSDGIEGFNTGFAVLAVVAVLVVAGGVIFVDTR